MTIKIVIDQRYVPYVKYKTYNDYGQNTIKVSDIKESHEIRDYLEERKIPYILQSCIVFKFNQSYPDMIIDNPKKCSSILTELTEYEIVNLQILKILD